MKLKRFNTLPVRIKLLASIMLLVILSAFVMKGPRTFPTGVTVYKPEKAYNSFTLFSARDGKTHLIDMNGSDVHQWSYVGQPAEFLDPAVVNGKLGHVILQLENGTGSFDNKVIGELDWDGKVIWQWGKQAPGGEAQQHHDQYRLANGNTIILAHKKSNLFEYTNLTDDVIYEVTPKGEVVWKWISTEHIGEFGFTEESLTYLKKKLAQSEKAGRSNDYLHINAMHVLGENKWYKAGDKRFHPDNIIFDSRNANFVAIIDKQSGKIVWRLGPDFPESAGNNVPRAVDQIVGQHDAHLIAEGLPGAGNLLLFDNQGSAGYPPVSTRSYSRILEINPVTQEIVWEYRGGKSKRTDRSFFSSYISNSRRLPNGNTFINEGMNGRFFQVTPSGEIVWEYVCPIIKRSVSEKADDSYAEGKEEEQEVFENTVYRAQPVPYEWAPKGTPRTENPVKEVDVATYRVPQ